LAYGFSRQIFSGPAISTKNGRGMGGGEKGGWVSRRCSSLSEQKTIVLKNLNKTLLNNVLLGCDCVSCDTVGVARVLLVGSALCSCQSNPTCTSLPSPLRTLHVNHHFIQRRCEPSIGLFGGCIYKSLRHPRPWSCVVSTCRRLLPAFSA